MEKLIDLKCSNCDEMEFNICQEPTTKQLLFSCCNCRRYAITMESILEIKGLKEINN